MKSWLSTALRFIVLASAIVLWSFASGFSKVDRCKSLRFMMCRKLGYNKTRGLDDLYPSMPMQELEQYIRMIDAIRCSPDALFFLCTVYSPVCFQQYTPRVLPCRSVCEKVKNGCMSYVRLAGFSWPSELDCQRFPDYNTGVCIRPSAIVSSLSSNATQTRKDLSARSEFSAVCPKCDVQHGIKKYKQFKRASYVIEAVVNSRITTAKGQTKLIVNIKKVYKEGKKKISLGTKSLMSPRKCLCPEVEFDQTFIIFGQEDKRSGKLLHDQRSILAKASKHFNRKMHKWARKYNKHIERKNQRAKKQMNA